MRDFSYPTDYQKYAGHHLFGTLFATILFTKKRRETQFLEYKLC